MEFKRFKELMQLQISVLLANHETLFETDVSKDELWETYLESFPPGSNEIFRSRREHDCSCCRNFIKSFGNVVALGESNEILSIWDFIPGDKVYSVVTKALSGLVKSRPIRDVFVTKEAKFGVEKNYEENDGAVKTWEHLYVELPKVTKSSKSREAIKGEFRDIRNVFKRSLDEISIDSVEVVLDLISQNSLYKGEEWGRVLVKFLSLQKEYHELPGEKREVYCWRKSVEVGGVIGKIRNHSIGTLLVDISSGVDLDEAVRKYERMVAPTNYKRPKAIFTAKMVEQAQNTLGELGLLDSLGRRFACIEDISVNNILFANRDSLRKMDVFFDLKSEVIVQTKKFDWVEEVPIDRFLLDIIPRTTNIEIYLENRHEGNLVSLIAAQNKESKSLFKWSNGFSWAYNGNITDSMKARVKAAGGNVEGVLRFSLQWNENGDNQNDFDAHCVEPNGDHIWFKNKGCRHPSSGMLDVDIIHPSQIAVENIAWTSIERMQEGVYLFYIHNYTHRGGRSGFRAEIEYNEQIYSFNYQKELRQDESVIVAKVDFNKKKGLTFLQSLPSSTSSKQIWGISTNQFHPVSVLMFSPNYWDGQISIGHRHYFFLLKGCINDTSPNGFFNEFLREDLMIHKRVFEALGSKMKVSLSDNQLSGLGFSSTKRDSLVCKIEGHTTRTIKVLF